MTDKEIWEATDTFEGLCKLTAKFLEGDFGYSLGQTGGPDDETKRIAEPLATLNRAGLLTTCSQPGESAQRAFVDGYAPEDVAKALYARGLYADVDVRIVPPGVQWGYRTPVTVEEGRPFTWAGASCPDDHLTFARCCHPEVQSEILDAWAVIAIDPAWGRTGTLWDVLTAPLREGFDSVPHPNLGLERDFVC